MLRLFGMRIDKVENVLGNFHREFVVRVTCGIVKHTCAHAILTACASKDVAVDATGCFGSTTALPVFIIVSEFVERHGHVTKTRVDAHHCATAGQTKDFSLWPAHATQTECEALDACSEVVTTELGNDNQT